MITWRQLLSAGLARARIHRLVARGMLHRLYRGIYTVGHRRLETHGRLAAALLYASPGAMLDGLTGAWWWEVIPFEPPRIHVASPRRVRPAAGIVHRRVTAVEPVRYRKLPVRPIEYILIDVAPQIPVLRLRRAISEALFNRRTTVARIDAVLGRGRAGSGVVRAALERHRQGVQRSRSEKEEALFLICEQEGIPLPLVNRTVAGEEVDFFWPDLKLAVEVDGPGHAEVARMANDRARDMKLRAAGIHLIRYTDVQVIEDAQAVGAELRHEVAWRQRTPAT